MSGATVLVVGSGGREHALAWKLSQSPQVGRVLVAPGNGGTARAFENVDVAATDTAGLLALVDRESVSLTVVGPEGPLAAGLVDALTAHGHAAFGPSRACAQLEASKAFSKQVMDTLKIPTATWTRVSSVSEGRSWLREHAFEVVVKASGLAAGKGVVVCENRNQAEESLENILVYGSFGEAGAEVVIEERLMGEEVSLLCFSDGAKIEVMPAAQDHKRVGEGDTGPNTGGMGAYAPAPAVDGRTQMYAEQLLQPVVDWFRHQGTPYVGVLYAGLMITDAGAYVLEYNCRFGNPETQVLLPLIDNDLYEVMMACVEGRLHQEDLRIRAGVAATVVAASGGYPQAYDKGKTITGLEDAEALDGVTVFHAGTATEGESVVTSGGRVLAVTGVGDNLAQALNLAYEGIDALGFEGMHCRRDIGWRALQREES